MKLLKHALLGLFFCLASISINAQNSKIFTITGGGDALTHKLVSVWANIFEQTHKNLQINYRSTSSSTALVDLLEDKVDFALIGKPLNNEQLVQNKLDQTPFLLWAIAPAINIPGIKAGELVLDSNTLLAIFTKQITHWDDPAITRLNPELQLPHKTINVIRNYADKNTAFYFMLYLTKSTNKQISAQKIFTNAPGDEHSIADTIKQNVYSIGITKHYYAKHENLSWTRLINRDHRSVAPTAETLQAAVIHANINPDNHFQSSAIYQAGANSWPITAITYAAMKSEHLESTKHKLLHNFLIWALAQHELAINFGYSPLPNKLAKVAAKTLTSHNVQTLQTYPIRRLFPTVRIITTQKTYQLYKQNRAVIVDTRSQAEYDIIHINSAKLIPFAASNFATQLKTLPTLAKNKAIIFYCNGTTCAKSYRAAKLAKKMGIKNTYAYDAGIIPWARKHPQLTTLLGETPANLSNLISNAEFSVRNLTYEQFKKMQFANDGIFIDIRDEVQRRIKLTELPGAKHRAIKFKGVISIPQTKFIALIKQGKYKQKNLFIFDAVGKQTRWVQYYLKKYGYKNYWFLQGGVRAVLGKEKHF